MTETLESPSPQLPSSSSSIQIDNDLLHQESHLNHDSLINSPSLYPVAVYGGNTVQEERISGGRRDRKRREREEGDQLTLLAVFVTAFRRSLVACRSERVEELSASMEIGWPTNVRHVAHVTFDRFNGFHGLPVEFEPEVPTRPPSASTSVFGVSTESMQLSFDSRGNSVPIILLMMQRRLYAQGGLQAEGIFRINAENSQEEYVREQLNRGVVPDDIDVHCLAGLIKAWFRELPNGLLDSLSPEHVMQAQSEDECARLARLLPPTEAAMLDWAINLMADVAQLEHLNKMNARNIAMVFAPNMTQMADPLTALMHAVQVMNFLKTLIVRTLREREDSVIEPGPALRLEPSDRNGHNSSSQPIIKKANQVNEAELVLIVQKNPIQSPAHPSQRDSKIRNETHDFLTYTENIIPDGKGHLVNDSLRKIPPNEIDSIKDGLEGGLSNMTSGGAQSKIRRTRTGQSGNSSTKKGFNKVNERPVVRTAGLVENSQETSIVSRLNSRTERVETWR